VLTSELSSVILVTKPKQSSIGTYKENLIMKNLITRNEAAVMTEVEFNNAYESALAEKSNLMSCGVTAELIEDNKFIFEQFNELYEAKSIRAKAAFETKFNEVGEDAYYL
jgi:hypothetical protein